MNKKTEKILLGHGSGGILSRDLTRVMFVKIFDIPLLNLLLDSAVMKINKNRFAFTTDSYVVKPIFFPGGDIGKLSVCGTINDLAVMGATPLFISCGLIIEEGFPTVDLEKITRSMQKEAAKAGVQIVTGDTKVVEKGSCDKIFINTAGIGIIDEKNRLSTKKISAGDKIILSGTIGDHGLAILSERESFDLKTNITSDCASLNSLIADLKPFLNQIKLMRDPTRGGLATVLNEFIDRENLGILIDENFIPVKASVLALCELLGLDPVYIANEGKVVIICTKNSAPEILEIIRENKLGRKAAIIGEVVKKHPGKVCMRTKIGGTRIIDMLVSDQLPRIC